MQVGDLVRFYESTHPEYNGIVIWRGRMGSPIETVKILMCDGSTQLRSEERRAALWRSYHQRIKR